MPRATTGRVHRKRSKKILKATKGYIGARSTIFRTAKDARRRALAEFLYRPPEEEAGLQGALDRADSRGLQAVRHVVQQVHRRAEIVQYRDQPQNAGRAGGAGHGGVQENCRQGQGKSGVVSSIPILSWIVYEQMISAIPYSANSVSGRSRAGRSRSRSPRRST